MKGFGGGWPKGRILEKMGLNPAELLHFNPSQPTVSQVVGITDTRQLKFAIDIARHIQPMPDAEQDAARACARRSRRRPL
jgi:hypothetical protein